MIIYDGTAMKPYNKPWFRAFFAGCFGDRKGSMCNWVVPGTWPDWCMS